MLKVFIFLIFLNVVNSQGCGKASPFTRSARQTGFMTSSSLNRTFNIYLPASYNVNVAMPVLLLFHGGGGTGIYHKQLSKFYIRVVKRKRNSLILAKK